MSYMDSSMQNGQARDAGDSEEPIAGFVDIDPSIVAEVCRVKFLEILCQPVPPEGNPRWLDVAELLLELRNHSISMTWGMLAERLASKLGMSLEKPLLRVTWEAVARTGVNLVTSLDSQEFEEARTHDWRPWVLEKLGASPEKQTEKE